MNKLAVVDEAISFANGVDMSKWFDEQATGWDGIVVAGASGLVSKHALAGLGRARIRPLALADNNSNLWGSRIEGVPILSPAKAVRTYPNAVFVAAIFTHTPLRQQLRDLGANRVVSYAHLFHKWPSECLPYFAVSDPKPITEQAQDVRRAAGIWADDESRRLYAAVVNWFVTLNSEAVPDPLPAGQSYFPDMLRLRDDEVFVDCGAYTGDTVSSYIALTGGRYRQILALEPDPDTFRRLTETVATMERVTCLNVAAGAGSGRLPFLAGASPASHAAFGGADGLSVEGSIIEAQLTQLDDLEPYPTYVKWT